MTKVESFVNDQNASLGLTIPSLTVTGEVAPVGCFAGFTYLAVTAYLATRAAGGKFDEDVTAGLNGAPSDMSSDQLVGLVRDLRF